MFSFIFLLILILYFYLIIKFFHAATVNSTPVMLLDQSRVTTSVQWLKVQKRLKVQKVKGTEKACENWVGLFELSQLLGSHQQQSK